ncbi:MAG: HD domain-containing protein [Deltaproteobacteria bacterium]|nr:HD domain-containing protein [Deltaproteobacteria bacterium]MBW1953277.1 HD domain-containing protein [Deltaproteobacteria bacterium]MBW1987438.1 HD domain-containing protein [Deltaproteobacteria bacterium]MBW2135511.1 HD domain-containing protein [Deltaproteobacteria bacterium]
MTDLKELRDELDRQEDAWLSPYATRSRQAIRRQYEERIDYGHRQNFAVDTDRILHSRAYTRYIDKTQVFYLIDHDQISHRVLHVQLLSKIARTIGRFLRLNDDLLEAIALGHDIGHPPFGHDGEDILSRLCQAHGIGHFVHSVQGVRFLDRVEKGGRGLNLSLQVLDGILSHDGESHLERLAPDREKTFAQLQREIDMKLADPEINLKPMTLEGCVVRLADTISYIGRDLEDAILLNLVRREDLPPLVQTQLGQTNGTIVYSLVSDLIENSFNKNYVCYSPEIGAALRQLREFNYQRIYNNPRIKVETGKIEKLFGALFDRFLQDLEQEQRQSPIWVDFLAQMQPVYWEASQPAEIVRDFLASMTDAYFLRQCQELFFPQPLPARFA